MSADAKNAFEFGGEGGYEVLKVLGVLLSEARDSRSWGMTEEELIKKTGGDQQETMKSLGALLRQQVIIFHITQEGTAGPYAHRYRLADGIDVAVIRKQRSP